jgi:DNA-binding LytR/AlgR family response regulator
MEGGVSFLLGRSLREWEDRLPEPMFARIHRSTIVNLERVERVEEWSNRAFNVYVDGHPEPYRMSRRYAARLKQ